jgi:hypothetical protein
MVCSLEYGTVLHSVLEEFIASIHRAETGISPPTGLHSHCRIFTAMKT